MKTRTITVAIDSRCRLGGEPLIWGAAEGDDPRAARANAAEEIVAGGPHQRQPDTTKAAGLDVVTIAWDGPLPDGQDRRAIDLAMTALGR